MARHQAVMLDRFHDFDWFMYQDDDIEVTARHIVTMREEYALLRSWAGGVPMLMPGFLRVEHWPSGCDAIDSMHVWKDPPVLKRLNVSLGGGDTIEYFVPSSVGAYGAHWIAPREVLVRLWNIKERDAASPAASQQPPAQFSYTPQPSRPDAEFYENFHMYCPRCLFKKAVPLSRIKDFLVWHRDIQGLAPQQSFNGAHGHCHGLVPGSNDFATQLRRTCSWRKNDALGLIKHSIPAP